LLEIDVEVPFFVAGDNVGQKKIDVVGEQGDDGQAKSRDGDTNSYCLESKCAAPILPAFGSYPLISDVG
jgi:hypothetical protein